MQRDIQIINDLAEDADFPMVDEVWLCNVLQHVVNPDVIINKCKKAADVIRFFEPIDTGIDPMHHWSFNIDYFKNHFGDATLYPQNMDEPVFHKWRNAYGIWRK